MASGVCHRCDLYIPNEDLNLAGPGDDPRKVGCIINADGLGDAVDPEDRHLLVAAGGEIQIELVRAVEEVESGGVGDLARAITCQGELNVLRSEGDIAGAESSISLGDQGPDINDRSTGVSVRVTAHAIESIQFTENLGRVSTVR